MYKTNQIAVLVLLQTLTSCCLVLCFFVGSSSPDSGRNQDAVALGLFTGKHRQVSDVVSSRKAVASQSSGFAAFQKAAELLCCGSGVTPATLSGNDICSVLLRGHSACSHLPLLLVNTLHSPGRSLHSY